MARGASCVRSRAVPRTEERLQTLADPEARWLDPVDGSGRGSCAAECLGVRGCGFGLSRGTGEPTAVALAIACRVPSRSRRTPLCGGR